MFLYKYSSPIIYVHLKFASYLVGLLSRCKIRKDLKNRIRIRTKPFRLYHLGSCRLVYKQKNVVLPVLELENCMRWL